MILDQIDGQEELLLRRQRRINQGEGAIRLDIHRVDILLTQQSDVSSLRHKAMLQTLKPMRLEGGSKSDPKIPNLHGLIQ